MHTSTLIIGAGAAGLAAGRALADAGQPALLLEARTRLGGRVWTDYDFGPVPVERGAEFVHGSAVGSWPWLRRAGLPATPFASWGGRRIWLGAGRLAGPWLASLRTDVRRLLQIEAELGAYHGPDVSLATWLAQRGYSPLARHLADLRLAHANCATPDSLSVAELAHEERTGTGDGANFHVPAGYDRLLAYLAQGLDIRLATAVEVLRWDASGIEASTPAGVFRARQAIITLPLAQLKAEAVRFIPELPARKHQAISGLVMHPAAKLVLRFKRRFWDRQMTFLSADDPAPVWWTVQPDAPLLIGFLTGPRAARLAGYGTAGAIEAGLTVLETIFGNPPRQLYTSGMFVDWAAEAWIGGGYSSVPPGAHGLRAVLGEPCGALHFAGEATVSHDNPATVHGALHSGVRAAAEVQGGEGEGVTG